MKVNFRKISFDLIIEFTLRFANQIANSQLEIILQDAIENSIYKVQVGESKDHTESDVKVSLTLSKMFFRSLLSKLLTRNL